MTRPDTRDTRATNGQLYDRIGTHYRIVRRADPRIGAQITRSLGTARSVLNVGAGTGNYEPADRIVVAVEPSEMMARQRPFGSAPVVRAVAEVIPFPDNSFDAALAISTIHHWSDPLAGLSELARVAPRQVILMNDRRFCQNSWIYDYFPETLVVPSEQNSLTVKEISRCLSVIRNETVPIPADCNDGFGGAFWSRPESLLDPMVRAANSSIAQLQPDVSAHRVEHLREDLESGAWDARHGHLRRLQQLDMGYRLIVCGEREPDARRRVSRTTPVC